MMHQCVGCDTTYPGMGHSPTDTPKWRCSCTTVTKHRQCESCKVECETKDCKLGKDHDDKHMAIVDGRRVDFG